MTTEEPKLCDIVRVGESDDARSLELVGAEGVVLGLSEDGTTGEKWFVIQVGDLPTVMLPSRDLMPTGRSVLRTSVYSGDHLRVSEEGRVIGGDSNPLPPTDEDALLDREAQMSTLFADWVRGAIDRTDVPRLVSERPAVVLERIARGAGATRWFHLASVGDLELACHEFAPGSTVSFYFDDRIALLPYSDETVMRILDLIAAQGDAVVGALDDDPLEISVEFVASANELDEIAENLSPQSSVFVGAFPAADDDGHNAVTLTLPDRDGVTRRHPH